MQKLSATWKAIIPGTYTDSLFPLQYYFEVRADKEGTLHPMLNATLSNQPYFALMPAES